MGGVTLIVHSEMIGLLTETSLHAGTSQSTGAIDLPVQRERATGYPVVVGSSLKGALRAHFKQTWADKQVHRTFGGPDEAGVIGISDGRLLLLPIRSLQHAFVWVTCPYLLERFKRDLLLTGHTIGWQVPIIQPATPGDVLIADLPENSTLFLEEFAFTVRNHPALTEIANDIAPLMAHDSARARLRDHLAIISDKDFGYFAQFGLPVYARNELNDNKISKSLWYEESLPTDSLLYYLVLSESDSLEHFIEHIKSSPYIQLGGNESIGQGFCIQIPWHSLPREDPHDISHH